MAVIRLDIDRRGPYAGGASFGEAGAYERLDGRITFAADPTHAANAGIVDLDRAARDAEGRVQFAADFCLLQPGDPTRGNGRLLFEVLNRGRKLAPRMFNDAPSEDPPTTAIDPGDGFLLRRGWTMAWCGWQWDVIASDALMGLDAPAACEAVPGQAGATREIAGQVSVWWQPNAPAHALLLADRVHTPYPAATRDDPDATLLVRDWLDGPATVVPRDQWRFARDEGGVPVPDDTYLWLDGGFVPGKVYEVTTTRGGARLSVRDCSRCAIAWLFCAAAKPRRTPAPAASGTRTASARRRAGGFCGSSFIWASIAMKMGGRSSMACSSISQGRGGASSTSGMASRRSSTHRASGTCRPLRTIPRPIP